LMASALMTRKASNTAQMASTTLSLCKFSTLSSSELDTITLLVSILQFISSTIL
jgi:hypothetical protein